MITTYFVVGFIISVISLIILLATLDDLYGPYDYRMAFFLLLSAGLSWALWPLVVGSGVLYGLVAFYKKGWGLDG